MVPGGGGRAQEPALLGSSMHSLFGFFRLGELLPEKAGGPPPMLLADLSTDSHSAPSVFQLLVMRSKTDPSRKGVRVSIRDSEKDICPVIALADYLRICPWSERSIFMGGWEISVKRALCDRGLKSSGGSWQKPEPFCWSQLSNRSSHNSRSPHSYDKVPRQVV